MRILQKVSVIYEAEQRDAEGNHRRVRFITLPGYDRSGCHRPCGEFYVKAKDAPGIEQFRQSQEHADYADVPGAARNFPACFVFLAKHVAGRQIH